MIEWEHRKKKPDILSAVDFFALALSNLFIFIFILGHDVSKVKFHGFCSWLHLGVCSAARLVSAALSCMVTSRQRGCLLTRVRLINSTKINAPYGERRSLNHATRHVERVAYLLDASARHTRDYSFLSVAVSGDDNWWFSSGLRISLQWPTYTHSCVHSQ